MLVYWFIFIWTILIGHFFPASKSRKLSDTDVPYMPFIQALFILFPLIFFAFFRTQCIDTAAYINHFVNAPTDMSEFSNYVYDRTDSNLFYGALMLFKCFISQNPTMWLGTIAVIQGVFTLNFFRKYSANFSMSSYIFIASTLFTWMYNGIRQYLAVSILLACTDWLLKRKWWLYIPLVLLLSGLGPIFSLFGWGQPVWFLGGIHQSALMMLPVYFLANGKPFNWRVWVLVVLLIVLALTGSLNDAIESAAENTAYKQDMQYVQADEGSNIVRVLVALVPVILAVFAKRFDSNVAFPPFIGLCINLAVVTSSLYGVASLTSGIYIGRLPIYCEMYSLILLPWLIENVKWKDNLLFRRLLYVFYFIYFVYQMYFSWHGLTYVSSTLGIFLWGGSG